MNDLLSLALEAHGGLDRWRSFTSLSARLSIGGAVWELKGNAGLLRDVTFDMLTTIEEVAISPFNTAGRRSVFTPEILSIRTLEGEVVDSRPDPVGAFAGHTQSTPWDDLHVAYFASEALWTYLTSPFLYAYPGFVTREIEPWNEDGETWRRLEVTFPPGIATHTRVQTTHFGADGLMRRHDYTVDVLGGSQGANYTTDYRDFQGIKIPTTRRIYAYDENFRKVPEPLLVSIDIDDVRLS